MHDYRKFAYLDPGLPSELLPAHWPGTAAAALFREYYAAIDVKSQRYFHLCAQALKRGCGAGVEASRPCRNVLLLVAASPARLQSRLATAARRHRRRPPRRLHRRRTRRSPKHEVLVTIDRNAGSRRSRSRNRRRQSTSSPRPGTPFDTQNTDKKGYRTLRATLNPSRPIAGSR